MITSKELVLRMQYLLMKAGALVNNIYTIFVVGCQETDSFILLGFFNNQLKVKLEERGDMNIIKHTDNFARLCVLL